MRHFLYCTLILACIGTGCGDLPDEDDIPEGATCNFTPKGDLLCEFTSDKVEGEKIDLGQLLGGSDTAPVTDCYDEHTAFDCVTIDQTGIHGMETYVGQTTSGWLLVTNECQSEVQIEFPADGFGDLFSAEFAFMADYKTVVPAHTARGYEVLWTPYYGELEKGSGDSVFHSDSALMELTRMHNATYRLDVPVVVSGVATEPVCPTAIMWVEDADTHEEISAEYKGSFEIEQGMRIILHGEKSYSNIAGHNILEYQWSVISSKSVAMAPMLEPAYTAMKTEVTLNGCGEYAFTLQVADAFRSSCDLARIVLSVCTPE